VELQNGFKAYLIKAGAPGQIAYVTVVRTGAREEWEPGRSGFAHFFEHIMFRGTKKYPDYDAITTKIGAARNASTSIDVTQYYLVASSDSLEQIIDKVLIVEKNTKATPISFGFPISLLRSDADFYAMMLANSWLGEHRESVSHLYQVIREKRGMNYGDYSYIEAYPRGYATQVPPTNVSRRSQIFEVWIRPIAMTAPGTLHDRSLFAFRAALREVATLADKGMTKEDFETQRGYLKNYYVNFGTTVGRRLAYRIDDVFYGIRDPGFLASTKAGLDALTLERVNAAIKEHLQARNLWTVFITQDAEAMKKKLLQGAETNITYAGKQPQAVLDEDKIIATYPIPVTEKDITIVNINDVFEK